MERIERRVGTDLGHVTLPLLAAMGQIDTAVGQIDTAVGQIDTAVGQIDTAVGQIQIDTQRWDR